MIDPAVMSPAECWGGFLVAFGNITAERVDYCLEFVSRSVNTHVGLSSLMNSLKVHRCFRWLVKSIRPKDFSCLFWKFLRNILANAESQSVRCGSVSM